MSDIGDDFRALKEFRKEKRDAYKSGQMLEDIQLVRNASAHIDEKNGGEHLIVTAENGRIIDYWPGTKRWIARRTSAK
jgi:hypothetical protein